MQVLDESPAAAPRSDADVRPEPLRRAAPFVLLDDSLTPAGGCSLFEDPIEIVRCDHPAQAEAALDALARGLDRGLHAAGFLSYELGYLLEPRLAGLVPEDRAVPLIWMGLFERRRPLVAREARCLIERAAAGGHEVSRLRWSMDRADYLRRVRRVQDYIEAGDVYQINLTFKCLFDFAGDPLSLYAELRRKQPVAHGALIHGPEADILSLSPELFLSISERRILAKPMKGTAARRPLPADDDAQRAWLRGDPKSRAENLMIVDLLRNDVGRIAEIGTVEVPALFTVETYPTVHQMTSSVTGRLRAGVGLRELVGGLFPCGSITGAPKVRAMEIIRELEPAARGVYTGAIGAIAPGGDLAFNVAIRTLALYRDGRGEMGIGSGIVYDSDAEAEYDECLLKARFLTAPFRPFRLIETLRWTRNRGHYLLDRHLARLAASADRLGFPCDPGAVRRALDAQAAGFADDTMRVRLTLDQDGAIEVSAAPLSLPAPGAELSFALSDRPVDPDDPLIYHKTTRRELYDGELARLRATTGCDEVVFANGRGELTEGSRTNLFVERDGRLLTPPVSSGLLDGVLRRALLDDPAAEVEERILRPADLAGAERIWLGNSVRGLVRARPVG